MAFDWRQLHADFQQRHQETWTFVQLPHGADIFFITSIDRPSLEPVITLKNENQGQIVLNYDSSCELQFKFPKIGYFNHNGNIALYFRRKSAKRFKRGVCKENSQIISPYSSMFGFNVPFVEATLRSAFNPQYPVWPDAIDSLKGKVLSVALSPELAVGNSFSSEEQRPILWFNTKPVAVAEGVSKVIVYEDIFKQEVVDYFKGTNVEVV